MSSINVTCYLKGVTKETLLKQRLFRANKSKWVKEAIILRLKTEGVLPEDFEEKEDE